MTGLDPSLPGRLDALAAGWTALSRLLLAPPSDDTLAQVRNPALLDQWPLRDDTGATERGKDLLLRSATAGEDAAAVGRDFARLFIGPERLKAPPWESVHRSREGLLFDAETLQVRQWYSRYGLEAPRLNREPDDHIGLELEFCAHMARLAIETPDARSDIEADIGLFLTDHLSLWAFMLAELMVEHADTLFHRGVGRLLAGTVSQSVDAFAAAGSGS